MLDINYQQNLLNSQDIKMLQTSVVEALSKEDVSFELENDISNITDNSIMKKLGLSVCDEKVDIYIY